MSQSERNQQSNEKSTYHNDNIIDDKMFSDFLSHVSYEINMPLTVILSATSLLKRNCPPNDKKSLKYIDMITKHSLKLYRFSQNFVSMSRIYSAGKEALDLHNVEMVSFLNNICKSVSDIVKNNNVKIKFLPKQTRLVTAVDAMVLERGFLTILSYSIKYATKGSTVSITLWQKDDNMLLSFENSSTGITREELQQLISIISLDRDTRYLKECGIGLGLSKIYINLHEGTVAISEQPNNGIKLSIEMPIRLINEKNVLENFSPSYNDTEDFIRRLAFIDLLDCD